MSNSELKMISLEDISISKTNPRKTFDLSAQKDLIKSVKMHGILQPILIRPIPDDFDEKGNQKGYELVCGERRFKASKAAKLKEIPCNIRTLTDDEAFELQIIENLERKDVHPLEEADAFKRMLDSEKYTLTDIAAKVVKSEAFVAGRLKLVELIDPIREDFIKGYLGVGHATLIAKFDEDTQHGIFDDCKAWRDGDEPDYGTYQSLKENLSDDTLDLSDAVFDLQEDYNGCQVSCAVCPKRSKSNPTLFPEFQDEDICFDEKCFDQKTEIFTQNKLAKILNEGLDFVIVASSNPSDFIKEMCKQFDVHILKWFDDYRNYQFNNWIEKQAFKVSGREIGKVETVWVKPEIKNENGTVSKVETTVQDQITKIEERAKRSLELDNEKVEAAIREKIESAPEHKFYSDKPFTEQVELAAVIFSVYNSFKYQNRKWFQEEIAGIKGYYHDYGEKKIWDFILLNGNDIMLREMLRRLTFETLTDRQVADKESNGFSDAFYKLNELYHPFDLQIIQDAQDEIAKHRILRTDAKIKKLKESL